MPNEDLLTTEAFPESRIPSIVQWIASLVVAGILAPATWAKFFNFTPEGSMALADALGVGRGAVTLIGVVETGALIGILIPRSRTLGASLAVATMSAALFAHATRIGFSGSPAAEMWPMALVALVAALGVLLARSKALGRR